MARHYWAKDEIRLCRKLYPHQPTADVAATMGRSVSAVYRLAWQLGVRKTAAYLASPAAHRLDGVKGLGSRFQAGHTTWNKGLKGWTAGGRSKLTRFKKGNRSKRWNPEDYAIGALRINSDGQLDIKVREGMRGWYCMARWVWMTERGPIPPKGLIRAINGDPCDTRIENLRLATRGDLMRENTYHRYPKEIARLIQLRGALQRQINKREGKREQHNQRPS